MMSGTMRVDESAGSATTALRVLIADDEPLARDDLARLLGGRPDVTIVGLCAGGAEAVRAVRQLEPDVLFLDIRMPGVDGFQVVTRLDPACMPYIVFVTAFDRYAVEAFRIRALDYVLKPVHEARLDDALARAREQLRMRTSMNELAAGQNVAPGEREVASGAAGGYWSDILVHVGTREVMIQVTDLEWVEADTYYARLHVGGRSYLHRERMHVLEAHLDPEQFIRVHRSAIVNVNHVRELRRLQGGEPVVVLTSGRQVKASRARWVDVRARMRRRSRGAHAANT